MKKKIYLVLLLLILIPCNVIARNKVTLNKCVDGDTAYFNINNKKTKVRFLAIDTPESTNKIERYGKEASHYTCSALKNANVIELEYDVDYIDKYGRTLAWIWIDNTLLQDSIVSEGYGEVKYLYGNYKYTDTIKKSEKKAKLNKLNIWSDNTIENNTYYFLLISITIIILYIFSLSFRKKTNKKIKNSLKKEFNKIIK